MAMDDFAVHLDNLLQGAFQSVLKIEEQMLTSIGQFRLSINEIHLLEAVGKGGECGKLVGELAKELQLTPPSVTVAVKKLEQKGLLQKAKGPTDARTVRITLTETGAKVERVHQRFHVNMVKGITADMNEQEKEVLLRAMGKLNDYFDRRLTTSTQQQKGQEA